MDHPSSPVYVIVAVFPDENDARLALKKAQTDKKFVMKRAVASAVTGVDCCVSATSVTCVPAGKLSWEA